MSLTSVDLVRAAILRQTLAFLNVHAMAQPEAYIGHAGQLFDANGKITNEGTQTFLKSVIGAFGGWVEKLAA